MTEEGKDGGRRSRLRAWLNAEVPPNVPDRADAYAPGVERPSNRVSNSDAEPPVPAHLLAALWTLRVDTVTAEVSSALDTAGIPNLVLKGASFNAWLHPTGPGRVYGDSDLLVAP